MLLLVSIYSGEILYLHVFRNIKLVAMWMAFYIFLNAYLLNLIDFAEEIQYSLVLFYAFFSSLKIKRNKRNGENLKRNGILGIAFIFKLPDLIYVVVGSE